MNTTLTVQLFRAGPHEGLDGLLAQVIEMARANGRPCRRVVYAVETARSGQTDKAWLKAAAEAYCKRLRQQPYTIEDYTGIPDATLLVRLVKRESGQAHVAWEGQLGDFYVDNDDVYGDEDARDEVERSLYFNGAAQVDGYGEAWLESVHMQPGETH